MKIKLIKKSLIFVFIFATIYCSNNKVNNIEQKNVNTLKMESLFPKKQVLKILDEMNSFFLNDQIDIILKVANLILDPKNRDKLTWIDIRSLLKIMENKELNKEIYDLKYYKCLQDKYKLGFIHIAENNEIELYPAERFSEEVLKDHKTLSFYNDSHKIDFHYLLREDCLESIDVLINRKIFIHNKHGKWQTPLHIAVKMQKYDIVKSLLKNGADPNTLMCNGDLKFTVLSTAINSDKTNISRNKHNLLKLLLKNGANPKLGTTSIIWKAIDERATNSYLFMRYGEGIVREAIDSRYEDINVESSFEDYLKKIEDTSQDNKLTTRFLRIKLYLDFERDPDDIYKMLRKLKNDKFENQHQEIFYNYLSVELFKLYLKKYKFHDKQNVYNIIMNILPRDKRKELDDFFRNKKVDFLKVLFILQEVVKVFDEEKLDYYEQSSKQFVQKVKQEQKLLDDKINQLQSEYNTILEEKDKNHKLYRLKKILSRLIYDNNIYVEVKNQIQDLEKERDKLFKAVRKGKIGIIELEVNKYNVNYKKNDRSLLYYAYTKKNKKIIKHLLAQEPNLRARDENKKGLTILLRIVNRLKKSKKKKEKNYYIEVVKKLIEKDEQFYSQERGDKALVNLGDVNGTTALSQACKDQNLDLIEILLEAKNIDINQPVYYKSLTPLHLAVRKKRKDLVLKLLDKGADINKESEEGLTPLMLAIEIRSREMLEILFKRKTVLKFNAKWADILSKFNIRDITTRYIIRDLYRYILENKNNDFLYRIVLQKINNKKNKMLLLETIFDKSLRQCSIDILNSLKKDELLPVDQAELIKTVPILLLKAIKRKDLQIVKFLLEKKVSVRAMEGIYCEDSKNTESDLERFFRANKVPGKIKYLVTMCYYFEALHFPSDVLVFMNENKKRILHSCIKSIYNFEGATVPRFFTHKDIIKVAEYMIKYNYSNDYTYDQLMDMLRLIDVEILPYEEYVKHLESYKMSVDSKMYEILNSSKKQEEKIKEIHDCYGFPLYVNKVKDGVTLLNALVYIKMVPGVSKCLKPGANLNIGAWSQVLLSLSASVDMHKGECILKKLFKYAILNDYYHFVEYLSNFEEGKFGYLLDRIKFERQIRQKIIKDGKASKFYKTAHYKGKNIDEQQISFEKAMEEKDMVTVNYFLEKGIRLSSIMKPKNYENLDQNTLEDYYDNDLQLYSIFIAEHNQDFFNKCKGYIDDFIKQYNVDKKQHDFFELIFLLDLLEEVADYYDFNDRYVLVGEKIRKVFNRVFPDQEKELDPILVCSYKFKKYNVLNMFKKSGIIKVLKTAIKNEKFGFAFFLLKSRHFEISVYREVLGLAVSKFFETKDNECKNLVNYLIKKKPFLSLDVTVDQGEFRVLRNIDSELYDLILTQRYSKECMKPYSDKNDPAVFFDEYQKYKNYIEPIIINTRNIKIKDKNDLIYLNEQLKELVYRLKEFFDVEVEYKNFILSFQNFKDYIESNLELNCSLIKQNDKIIETLLIKGIEFKITRDIENNLEDIEFSRILQYQFEENFNEIIEEIKSYPKNYSFRNTKFTINLIFKLQQKLLNLKPATKINQSTQKAKYLLSAV